MELIQALDIKNRQVCIVCAHNSQLITIGSRLVKHKPTNGNSGVNCGATESRYISVVDYIVD